MRDFSAGIIPVQFVPDGRALFLLLRVYAYWDFPKGCVESGEDPVHAAIRELREETALKDVRFPWGLGYWETQPYSRGKIARYYLGEVCGTPRVRLPVSSELGRPEHHEFRWVTYDEARHLLGERVRPVLDWAQKQIKARSLISPSDRSRSRAV